MTPDERLMLAEQGAADPELMGGGVSATAMRCKRCGWPIVSDPAKGCTIYSCSCRCESYPQCTCGSSQPLPTDPRDAEIVRGLNLPARMDDDLQFILGRPNFTCRILADIMRRHGHEIPRKAEAEQAAVIFWMLGHYHRAGSAWRDPADAEIKRWQEDARAAIAQSGEAG